MKTYLKDLKLEEIIKRLKNGEVVHSDGSWTYKMIDGIICAFCNEESYIGAMIDLDEESESYFETEEPFEIKETGLYKTRDGKKVFVYYVANDETKPVKGVIQEVNCIISWYLSGEYEQADKSDCDIISKWED